MGVDRRVDSSSEHRKEIAIAPNRNMSNSPIGFAKQDTNIVV
jgi:hypothetical protein